MTLQMSAKGSGNRAVDCEGRGAKLKMQMG